MGKKKTPNEIPPIVTGDLFCNDASYPTDNELEVPVLRTDLQAHECTKPFAAWGEQKRTFDLCYAGCLHFYVDDYRFNSLYEHPEKILKAHPKSIVEPNFSLYADTPIAFGLQAIYRKRWIARCMQERGIRIFVDLNVNAKFYRLNMLGVPMGWSAFATRGYSDRLANLEFEYDIARSWAKENPLTFVIYGGGIECRHFAETHGCIYITPLATQKKKRKAYEAISKECMFDFGDGFSLKKVLANSTAYDSMIENFAEKRGLEDKKS